MPRQRLWPAGLVLVFAGIVFYTLFATQKRPADVPVDGIATTAERHRVHSKRFAMPPRRPWLPSAAEATEDPAQTALDPDLANVTVHHPALQRALRLLDDAAFRRDHCGGDGAVARRVAADHAHRAAERAAHQRPRIAILTYYASGANFTDPTVRTMPCESQWNHVQYARRHGYDLLWDGPGDVLAPGKSAHWNKIVSLHRWLPHYDWVLWVDADALFLNQSITVEDIIAMTKRRPGAREDDLGFIIAAEGNMYNTGVLLVRGGESAAAKRSLEFLRAVYHYPNASREPHSIFNWNDQGAFNFVLYGFPATEFWRKNKSGWFGEAPGEVFNAKPYSAYAVSLVPPRPDKTLVVHFATFAQSRHALKRFFGPMAFTRMADRAALHFPDEASAAVQPCCVFQPTLRVAPPELLARARAAMPAPPPPLPSDRLQTLLREARPPWNDAAEPYRWGIAKNLDHFRHAPAFMGPRQQRRDRLPP